MLNSKLKILRYWYEMMIVDHGFLRLLYNNFHKIDDNMSVSYTHLTLPTR